MYTFGSVVINATEELNSRLSGSDDYDQFFSDFLEFSGLQPSFPKNVGYGFEDSKMVSGYICLDAFDSGWLELAQYIYLRMGKILVSMQALEMSMELNWFVHRIPKVRGFNTFTKKKVTNGIRMNARSPSTNIIQCRNDLRNKAARLGAKIVVVQHQQLGTGGSGFGEYAIADCPNCITMVGTAYTY